MAVTWTGANPMFESVPHRIIGGAIRNTAGTWAVIEDAYHRPAGIGTITENTAYELKLNYTFTGTKVGALAVTIDDALAPLGITTGASVGSAFSYIYFHVPFSCYVHGTTIENLHALWTGAITTTMLDDATLQITHPPTEMGNHPIVSMVSGNRKIHVGYNTNVITVKARDDLNGFIDYDGAAWTHTLSTLITAPVITFGSGILRVTHGDVGSPVGVPIIAPHGAYSCRLYNVADEYFEVKFYDSSNAHVTVADTNMSLWYSRSASAEATYTDDIKVFVQRGALPVPLANLQNVAGNNFWVTGWMEVAG
jgi:hypothetical protein